MTRWTQDMLTNYRAGRIKDDDNPDSGPEKKLTAKIMQWCKDNGYPHFHDRSRGKNTAGWLDHVIALPNGRTLYIEDKAAGGRLTPEQKLMIKKLMILGHEVHVIRSFKRFLEVVDEKTV